MHCTDFALNKINIHLTFHSKSKFICRQHLVVVCIIFLKNVINCDFWLKSGHNCRQRFDNVFDTSLELHLLFFDSKNVIEEIQCNLALLKSLLILLIDKLVINSFDFEVNYTFVEHRVKHALELLKIDFFRITMLVENVYGVCLGSIHNLSHPVDDLGSVDCCELLDELIVRNGSIVIDIKIYKECLDFFRFESYVQTFNFMLELIFS